MGSADLASVSPITEALTPAEADRLLKRAVHRTLASGERLYLGGERNARVHLLSSGALKLMASNPGGEETIVMVAVAGDVVGEVAAIDGLPQPLHAVAACPTEVMGIDAELFVEVVLGNPEAARCLLELEARRLRWAAEVTLERTAGEVPVRVAGRLLDLADVVGRIESGAIALDLPLAQADIGGLAGTCRESACKTLRRLKSRGVVDYGGKRLRILRPDVLERIRCGRDRLER